MRKRTHARECVLQILYQHEMNPLPLGQVMESFWKENEGQEEEVKSFAAGLVLGTRLHQGEIDEVIKKVTNNWDLGRMAVIDRSILRFATYELLFMEDIPSKVTINEAVNLAKKFSQEGSGKFVNGILDKISHTEKSRVEKKAEHE
ncbi:MAG: transcription antitermination factor NusB [Candidatus Omnitrophica bacterium]|nr:transcription antitermination factor NusB [Candidatus Omnitrophota bacterium]